MWGLSSLGQSRCTPITTWVRHQPEAWSLTVAGIGDLGAWGSQGSVTWGPGGPGDLRLGGLVFPGIYDLGVWKGPRVWDLAAPI